MPQLQLSGTLGTLKILHRQLIAEYLIPHYLGLVRITTIIPVQFKGDVEKAEEAQQNCYHNNPEQINYENRFVSWTSLVWWRQRGDVIAWIPEQQLQNVQPCGNVKKALKSSSQK